MTPLAAVAAGLLAGAVGTVCLDAVHYLKYRRAGGTDSPPAWEFAPVENWETAPDPGQVTKRVIEGFTQRKLPDRSAWLISVDFRTGTLAPGSGEFEAELASAPPGDGGVGGQVGVAQDG
jgi:hypothetical protein